MPAVAVTDTNNMFAALEFSVGAIGAGVQPIIGCQLDVACEPVRPGERPKDPAAVVLLAQNEAGYGNLMKLNSALYLGGDPGARAQVSLEDLEAYGAGLICLSGGPDGPVGAAVAEGRPGRGGEASDAVVRDLSPTAFTWSFSVMVALTGMPSRRSG